MTHKILLRNIDRSSPHQVLESQLIIPNDCCKAAPTIRSKNCWRNNMSSIVAGDKKVNTIGTTESCPVYQTGYLNGIIKNIGLLLTELPGGDRGDGIVAQKFIKEGTTLIETTLDDTVLTGKSPQTLAEQLLNAVTYDYYIKLLELRDVDMPGCFNMEEEKAEREDYKGGDIKFNGSLLMLLAERRAREAQTLSNKTAKPLRNCKAALHSVHSRCLFLQELSLFVLPPFVEYLNHDKNPNAHWILENGKKLVVKSRRPIQPGEEVTITYGNHSNEVFAIQYFFIPKNNPNDVLYMQLRREMTCMRLAKYDGTSVEETKSNFIPFGFVEYGNGAAMEVAKVVHPDDPKKFLYWKLTKMRQDFERNMILLMKKKRNMKKKGLVLDTTDQLWLEYLRIKVDLVNTHIKAIQGSKSGTEKLEGPSGV
jgi:hypothetical protein